MNVTFVTAFVHPRHSNPHRNLDVYFEEFTYLRDSGVPLIVFLDKSSKWDIPGAKTVEINTDLLDNNSILPSDRNPEKDTEDYFCVQAMKLELVTEAVQYCSTPYLAWIDFGVFHMMKQKQRVQEELVTLSKRYYPTDRLIAPGCWPSGEYGVDSVCWRFCGSFVLGHRSLWKNAYERQLALYRSLSPKLTWEVNIWAKMDDMFHVYSADHNESLFSIPEHKSILRDLIDNNATDKNTQHSYLDTYESLFSPIRDTVTSVLEIGIGGFAGGLRLFRKYFPNAMIYGADILHSKPEWGDTLTDERIQIHSNINAYTQESFELLSRQTYDIIIDDGPHTLESMKFAVSNYVTLLKEKGILIIEDVQDISWIEQLRDATPPEYQPYIQVYDLRKNKNRYDDILFVINTHSQAPPA